MGRARREKRAIRDTIPGHVEEELHIRYQGTRGKLPKIRASHMKGDVPVAVENVREPHVSIAVEAQPILSNRWAQGISTEALETFALTCPRGNPRV